jgi:hypothetical protein
MERLAVLRIDHQELQAVAFAGREELAALRSARDELLAVEEVWQERVAETDRIEVELRELRAEYGRVATAYAVNRESRSWRLTAPFRRARALVRPRSR